MVVLQDGNEAYGFEWGLSFKPARPEAKEIGIQCERNTGRFSEIYLLEGRDVFHLDSTCPRLLQCSRPYLQLRSCKCCPGNGLPSIPWASEGL